MEQKELVIEPHELIDLNAEALLRKLVEAGFDLKKKIERRDDMFTGRMIFKQ